MGLLLLKDVDAGRDVGLPNDNRVCGLLRREAE